MTFGKQDMKHYKTYSIDYLFPFF